MATDTAPKQTDAPTTPAKPAATAQAKPTPKPRAKTAAKPRSRTRATTARSRTAANSLKPASRPGTTAAPRTQATTPNGGRQVFAGVLDAQEKALTALADYQTRAAELSKIPGAAAIAGAQAQLLRGATDVYVSTARALLK